MDKFMILMIVRLRSRASVLERLPASDEDKAVARALREMADAIEEGLAD